MHLQDYAMSNVNNIESKNINTARQVDKPEESKEVEQQCLDLHMYVCMYVCMYYVCMYYVCVYACMYAHGDKTKMHGERAYTVFSHIRVHCQHSSNSRTHTGSISVGLRQVNRLMGTHHVFSSMGGGGGGHWINITLGWGRLNLIQGRNHKGT